MHELIEWMRVHGILVVLFFAACIFAMRKYEAWMFNRAKKQGKEFYISPITFNKYRTGNPPEGNDGQS